MPLSTVVIHELSLVGSRCGPFAPALQALSTRLVDPRPLVHNRFTLADGLAAFERAQATGVLKVLVLPE